MQLYEDNTGLARVRKKSVVVIDSGRRVNESENGWGQNLEVLPQKRSLVAVAAAAAAAIIRARTRQYTFTTYAIRFVSRNSYMSNKKEFVDIL